METVRAIYNDRIDDIESYFELVQKVESAIGMGSGILDTQEGPYRISPQQQKIMYSGVYLHLYNLVECTVTCLIEAVERHAANGINGDVSLLTDKMRDLYLKSVTGMHEPLTEDKKLENVISLFNQVLRRDQVDLKIPPGGGGNWDAKEIKRFSERIGINYVLPREILSEINRPFRNDENPIWLIKVIRNKLAHGSMSFTECGDNHVASDFRRLIDIVKRYLSCVIDLYDDFISNERYKIESI